MLVDTERRFTRLCLAREPREEDLEALGGMPDRWLLYRHMVRTRLRGMLETALRRTVEALGPSAFEGWFDRWLDEAPPRTRYVREIVREFGAFVLPRWEDDPEVPAWIAELAQLEATRWELGSLDAPAPEAGELAFERIPVVSPFVRVLRFDHPVHATEDPSADRPVRLCVYRRADDRTAVWPITELAASLLESFQTTERSVTETVKDVTARLSIPIDAELVQTLGAVLADFVQHGILLGAR